MSGNISLYVTLCVCFYVPLLPQKRLSSSFSTIRWRLFFTNLNFFLKTTFFLVFRFSKEERETNLTIWHCFNPRLFTISFKLKVTILRLCGLWLIALWHGFCLINPIQEGSFQGRSSMTGWLKSHLSII